MTEAETAVREALAKMTPGIWEWRKNIWLQEIKCGSLNVASSGSKHDAAGIVALKNHTPALLAELDAARAENARLREALGEYCSPRMWHWNADREVWEWNGDGSAYATGTAARASEFPHREDVEREPGAVARAALEVSHD